MIFFTAYAAEWILIELRETSNSQELEKQKREKALLTTWKRKKNIKAKSFIIEA